MTIEIDKCTKSTEASVYAWEQPQLQGERPWCHLIPRMHHALAAPRAVWTFPHYRNQTLDPRLSTAFWETPLYLMQTLLGWSDPGRGLQWWFGCDLDDAGDARLALLRQVWVDHQEFNAFAAWCWQRSTSYGCRGAFWHLVGDLAGPRGGERVGGTLRRDGAEFLGADWWTTTQASDAVTHGPFYDTASEDLHLGHSMSSDDATRPHGELVRSNDKDRRALLLLDEARAWYRQLLLHGRALPDLGTVSWHVDVVVKPLGHLGTFRRSRQTGLWFQGKHSVHMMGQLRRAEADPHPH